jgi:hypothetical protein
MSHSVLNIKSGRSFTVPNSTTPDNIVVWRNAKGTSLREASVSITGENMANLNSITLNEVAANPGANDTLWVDSAMGQVMLGTQNLHEIGGDVLGPAESTDNAIPKFDGSTGGLLQDSNVLIDDSDNVCGVKSILFTSSGSNPGAAGTLWFNARSGVLNTGCNEVIDSNSAQAVTNKMITGHTNLIDASNLQTTGTFVDVSSAVPATAGDVLTATSVTTAEWLSSWSPERL